MTAMPPVSVGLPVFNGERYVAAALGSVIRQSFGDLEIIISDNASTDGTEEICRDFASRDRRIRYERHTQNRGAAWNFNETFRRASGAYFKWLGHDDIWEVELLRRSIETLDSGGPAYVLCHPGTAFIDETGSVTELYPDNGLDLRGDAPHDRLRQLVKNLDRCNAIFGLIRSDVLRSTRLLGGYGGADTVLLAELALRGRFTYMPEVLFRRRFHPEQSGRAHSLPRQRAVWFDPANRSRTFIAPRWRLLAEHVRAVNSAELELGDRVNCYEVLLRDYLPRHRATLLGELRAAGSQIVGLPGY